MTARLSKKLAMPMLALSGALILNGVCSAASARSKTNGAHRALAQAAPAPQQAAAKGAAPAKPALGRLLAEGSLGIQTSAVSGGHDKDLELPPVDGAMLSIIKDIAKAARGPAQLDKLADPVQKAALKSALDALDAAVDNARSPANRIVEGQQKDKLSKSLSAESWESGLMPLPNNGQASLSILWAKKADGFINIAVAGNCDCKGGSPDARIGEYAVVFSGKTSVDSGFDIQSQSDVSFWLGKLSDFSADATKCGDGQTQSATRVPVLNAVVTADGVLRQAAEVKRQKIAQVRAEQERARTAQTLAAQTGTATAAADAAVPAVTTSVTAVPGQSPAPPPGLLYVPELKPPMVVPEHEQASVPKP